MAPYSLSIGVRKESKADGGLVDEDLKAKYLTSLSSDRFLICSGEVYRTKFTGFGVYLMREHMRKYLVSSSIRHSIKTF